MKVYVARLDVCVHICIQTIQLLREQEDFICSLSLRENIGRCHCHNDLGFLRGMFLAVSFYWVRIQACKSKSVKGITKNAGHQSSE